jgi:hypothetical protein
MDEELPFRYLWNDDSSLAEDTDTAAATASTAANATAADSPGSSLALLWPPALHPCKIQQTHRS